MSSNKEPYDIVTRGLPEQGTQQQEAKSSPPSFEALRSEFQHNFKSKTWMGVQDLSNHSTNRRALVIGINYGNRRPPGGLTGTYVDAFRAIKMLENFDYKSTDICVLADIAIPTTSFGIDLGEEDDAESRLPKRNNIIKALRWLSNNSGPEEYRFLYFSGHGHYQQYKPEPSSNQCIMPKDVEFERFQDCDGCVCTGNVWQASEQQGEPTFVPEPLTVLWDHNINRLLAGNLKAGTTMTAVLDCCYSGGVLETAFQNEPVLERTEPNSKGRRLYATMNGPSPANRVGLQAQDGLAEASEKTGNIWAQFAKRDNPTNSDINVEAVSPPQSATPNPGSVFVNRIDPGNILGLPAGIDVVTGIKYHTPRYNNTKSFRDPYEKSQKCVHSLSKSPETRRAPFQLGEMATRNQSLSPPFGTSQATSGYTCQRPGISSAIVPFNDGCTIMCWAACRKLESAFEDNVDAGWFTKALTEYLARPTNGEENLRSAQDLIDRLGVQFEQRNKTLKDRKRNLGEQHPQLFVSKNIGLALEDYLRLGLKI